MPTFPLCRGFKSFSENLPPFHRTLSHHYCLDRMISLFECTCWLHKSIIKDTSGELVENVLIKYSMSKNNKNKMGTHYTNPVLCPSLYVCTTWGTCQPVHVEGMDGRSRRSFGVVCDAQYWDWFTCTARFSQAQVISHSSLKNKSLPSSVHLYGN